MLNLVSMNFVLMTLIHNHFSISNPSTIYCVLGVSCYGPVLFGTGPVTANTNPVTVYTCPVPTNLVWYRTVYYRY
jgi:hypothetical protein